MENGTTAGAGVTTSEAAAGEAAAPAWSGAIDPALVTRLQRPARRPGLVRLGHARALLARHRAMVPGVPLAEALLRRVPEQWPEAETPVVAAHPVPAADPVPAGPVRVDETAEVVVRAARVPVPDLPAAAVPAPAVPPGATAGPDLDGAPGPVARPAGSDGDGVPLARPSAAARPAAWPATGAPGDALAHRDVSPGAVAAMSVDRTTTAVQGVPADPRPVTLRRSAIGPAHRPAAAPAAPALEAGVLTPSRALPTAPPTRVAPARSGPAGAPPVRPMAAEPPGGALPDLPPPGHPVVPSVGPDQPYLPDLRSPGGPATRVQAVSAGAPERTGPAVPVVSPAPPGGPDRPLAQAPAPAATPVPPGTVSGPADPALLPPPVVRPGPADPVPTDEIRRIVVRELARTAAPPAPALPLPVSTAPPAPAGAPAALGSQHDAPTVRADRVSEHSRRPPPPVDVGRITDAVSRRIARRGALEGERRGMNR